MGAGFFILKIFGLIAQKRELNKKKSLLSTLAVGQFVVLSILA